MRRWPSDPPVIDGVSRSVQFLEAVPAVPAPPNKLLADLGPGFRTVVVVVRPAPVIIRVGIPSRDFLVDAQHNQDLHFWFQLLRIFVRATQHVRCPRKDSPRLSSLTLN